MMIEGSCWRVWFSCEKVFGFKDILGSLEGSVPGAHRYDLRKSNFIG